MEIIFSLLFFVFSSQFLSSFVILSILAMVLRPSCCFLFFDWIQLCLWLLFQNLFLISFSENNLFRKRHYGVWFYWMSSCLRNSLRNEAENLCKCEFKNAVLICNLCKSGLKYWPFFWLSFPQTVFKIFSVLLVLKTVLGQEDEVVCRDWGKFGL